MLAWFPASSLPHHSHCLASSLFYTQCTFNNWTSHGKLVICCKTLHILDSISLWECVWGGSHFEPTPKSRVLMAWYDYRLWGDFCLVSTSRWEIERNITLRPSVCERKNILNIGFPVERQHSHSNDIPPSIHAHFVTVKRGLSNLSHSPHPYKV